MPSGSKNSFKVSCFDNSVCDLIGVRISVSVHCTPCKSIGHTSGALTVEQVSEQCASLETRTCSWYPAARSWFQMRSLKRVAWVTAALGVISALPGPQTEIRAQNQILVWAPQPLQA